MKSNCHVGDPPGDWLLGDQTKPVWLTISPEAMMRTFALKVSSTTIIIVCEITHKRAGRIVHTWRLDFDEGDKYQWMKSSLSVSPVYQLDLLLPLP